MHNGVNGQHVSSTAAGEAGKARISSEMIATSNAGSVPVSSSHFVLHRDPTQRPIYKLSVKLIDTYKYINKIYYEARAKKSQEQAGGTARGGVFNDGYDDQHYDYILSGEDIFADRYVIKHRIGKGSFGQVVCAYDQVTTKEVAIKIIKSRRPFMLQAQTEIGLLTDILQKDVHDEYNIVRMINKFVFRNHQCLVFEMLSYNLYELLKNTRFKGVSINLIRKFSKQILRSLKFLASPEVDIIHCDLKPENILLRHPRRSAVKLIDFGSSCLANRRTYTYIQSRFYRSPEILLGLKYDQKIDVWSLGCVLVEMHTGEPLFGGSDQVDQMGRIADVLGMPPISMIEQSPEASRNLFFERVEAGDVIPAACDPEHTCYSLDGTYFYALKRPNRDAPAPRTLAQIIGVDTGGPFGRRKDEVGHSRENYLEFLSFIEALLQFDPRERWSAAQAMEHYYITEGSVRDEDGMTPMATTTSETSTAVVNDSQSLLEKRRGREPGEWKPRSRSLSAPAGKEQQVQTSYSSTDAGSAGAAVGSIGSTDFSNFSAGTKSTINTSADAKQAVTHVGHYSDAKNYSGMNRGADFK